ncbi:MAG TPA: DUF4832 domain-containing protein [Thermoguttaceae bacterium]|nr:DUF4832 domain-containing protein [Thermoguttaceae bacterium]
MEGRHASAVWIGRLTALLATALLVVVSPRTGNAESLAPAAETVTVQFLETDEVAANPGKGWMTSQRLPGRTPRLPCSIAYFRVNWGDIEPIEGRPKWEVIDESIAAWEEHEVRIAFRIMTANAHTRDYYCSPKWLFDAGCGSYEYMRGGTDTMSGGERITRIEPDYADPLFLQKHGDFIAALARRYDGHPRIEFLDIGSYGIWGEWHTPNGKPWEVRRQIIDMYLDGFRKTALVQMSDDAEALAYSIAHGAGFRRDGVGSPWHEKTWIGSEKYAGVAGFADQWQRAPVVFEWFGPYDFLKRREWSFDRAVEFILANHATYINDNLGPVPDEELPKLHELARRSGYRFVLREVSHAATVSPGGGLAVEMKWSNVGVGKLYRRHPLVLYLVDADGNLVAGQEQPHVDPTTWLPGDHDVAGRIDVPESVTPGKYTLAVALLDPDTQKPAIRLPIDAPQQNRVHHVSRVSLQ